MNTVAGFRVKKMLWELKFTDSSSKGLISKDPGRDFMGFHVKAIVFTSQKPKTIAFLVMLAIGDSENDHRMKCNFILSIKKRGAHPAGCYAW